MAQGTHRTLVHSVCCCITPGNLRCQGWPDPELCALPSCVLCLWLCNQNLLLWSPGKMPLLVATATSVLASGIKLRSAMTQKSNTDVLYRLLHCVPCPLQELESALASSTHTIQDLKRRLAIAEAAAAAAAQSNAYRSSGGALLQGVHPDVAHILGHTRDTQQHDLQHLQGDGIGGDDASDGHSEGADAHGVAPGEATLAAGRHLHQADLDQADLNATLTLSPQLLQQHSLSDPELSSEPVFLFTRKSASSAGGGSTTGGAGAGTGQTESKGSAGGAAEAGIVARDVVGSSRASLANLGAPLVRPVSPPRSSLAMLQVSRVRWVR
jgi:hypothetical protein